MPFIRPGPHRSRTVFRTNRLIATIASGSMIQAAVLTLMIFGLSNDLFCP